MSNYTQVTNFTAKDNLTTGDPEKAISGADVDGEFSLISTAIATKFDTPTAGVAGQHLILNAAVSPTWTSGGYEFVDSFTASADSSCDIYHDGLDTSGTIDFIDGWEYELRGYGLYGSAQSRLFAKIYEAGAFRSGTNAYVYALNQTLAGAANNSAAFATASAILNGAEWGTTSVQTVDFIVRFNSLGSASRKSSWLAQSFGVNATPAYTISHVGGSSTGANATQHLQVITGTGTFTGELVLLRRKSA